MRCGVGYLGAWRRSKEEEKRGRIESCASSAARVGRSCARERERGSRSWGIVCCRLAFFGGWAFSVLNEIEIWGFWDEIGWVTWGGKKKIWKLASTPMEFKVSVELSAFALRKFDFYNFHSKVWMLWRNRIRCSHGEEDLELWLVGFEIFLFIYLFLLRLFL